MCAREAFGVLSRLAVLPVNDPAAADGHDVVALVLAPVFADPDEGTDHLVFADRRVVGLDQGRPSLVPRDPLLQGLTGLVGAVSGGRVLPPEVSARDPAPLCVISEQRGEWFRVAFELRFHSREELVDHRRRRRAHGL